MWLLPSACYRSAQELGVSTLGSAEQSVAEWWPTVSGTPTQRPSSWHGWKTRRWSLRLFGSETCASWTPSLLPGLMWSAPDTPASRFLRRETDREKTTSDTCGLKSYGSFAWYDHDTSAWRTSQATFLWDSTESSVILPNSGSMRSGVCFERQTLERPTSDGGFLSWPTPRSCSAMAATVNPEAKNPNLETVVARRGHTGQLNPAWVEWLMGFPVGWTVCDASGTPSSLSRPRSLSAVSCIEPLPRAQTKGGCDEE